MMRIHTDNNGVAVNAISMLADGTNVEGHQYQILAGSADIDLHFQIGPVQENSVNGITNEALLAVLAHRIKYLNDKHPCRENAIAITKVEEALHWLEARTKDRIDRGVEGTQAA